MPKPHDVFVAVAMTICALVHASDSLAQGTDTGSGLAQDRRGGPSGPALVQVGAGTTSASTTGYSGERKEPPAPPGTIEVPPLPDATLCDSYKGKPGYEGCLGVILHQSPRSQQ